MLADSICGWGGGGGHSFPLRTLLSFLSTDIKLIAEQGSERGPELL